MSKGWDLTSLNSLESAAEWIRKGSDALLVLVVRREDIAFAVHPDVRSKDAVEMVEYVLPQTLVQLERRREEVKAKVTRRAEKGQ